MLFQIILTIFTVKYCLSKSENMFSNDEEYMIRDLIQNLNIRRCIIAANDSSSVNPSIFTKLSDFKIYTSMRIVNEIFEEFHYVEWWSQFEEKMMIVYKSDDNIAAIKDLYTSLHEENLLYKLCQVTWLVFVQQSDIDLNIPYNCNFYLVHRFDLSSFKITEMYSIGTTIIFNDYGIWNGIRSHDFPKTRVSRFATGMKMNQTIIAAYDNEECSQEDYAPEGVKAKDCFQEELLRDIIRSMDFRFTDDCTQDNLTYCDLMATVYMIHEKYYDYLSREEYRSLEWMKYLPKMEVRLFIKYPDAKNTPDFYIKPFEMDMWAAVILTVFTGGLFCTLLKFIGSFATKRIEAFGIMHYFSIPFASLCNQGDDKDKNIAFRICYLIFGLLSIIILPSYCANLTAYLSIKTSALPFQDFDEFVANGEYKLLTNEDEEAYLYIYFTQWKDNMRNDLLEYYNSSYEYYEKICSNEKFVSSYTYPGSEYQIKCQIIRIPSPVATVLPVFYFFPNCAYTDIINNMFLKAWESGITTRAYKYVSGFWDKKFQIQEKELEAVETDQLIRIFSFFGFACFTGLVLLLCELSMKCVVKVITEAKRTNTNDEIQNYIMNICTRKSEEYTKKSKDKQNGLKDIKISSDVKDNRKSRLSNTGVPPDLYSKNVQKSAPAASFSRNLFSSGKI